MAKKRRSKRPRFKHGAKPSSPSIPVDADADDADGDGADDADASARAGDARNEPARSAATKRGVAPQSGAVAANAAMPNSTMADSTTADTAMADTAKADTAKADAAAATAAKADIAKADTAKADTAKADAAAATAAKADAAKADIAKADTARSDAAKADIAKADAAAATAAKADTAKASTAEADAAAATVNTDTANADAAAATAAKADADTDSAKADADTDSAKADSAKADSAKADSAKADSAKADSAKADSVKADSVKADSAKADIAKADTASSDAAKAHAAKADSARADIARADIAKASTAKADAAAATAAKADTDTDSAKADSAKAETAKTGMAKAETANADASRTDKAEADKAEVDKADKHAASKADKRAASNADKRAASKAKKARPRKPDKRGRKPKHEPKHEPKLPEAIVRREGGAPPEAVREPVFWFGFEVTWAKLAATRFVLFLLLALDALMQLPHAPRYGAGDFNVGHLPFLDELGPGRVAFGAGQVLLAYGFVLVAFGVATRVIVPVCAAIYAWLYFGSQLDSYQHHYLVAVALVIASFVPWQRPAARADDEDEAVPSTRVRSWALRLLLVQLAIVYLWAAISKLDEAWLDGSTLAMQMTGSIGAAIAKTVGFKVAAALIIGAELVLAATIWARPAWKIAAPLGLLFHIGIVFTGLEIGLFAFLMVGIYALVIPEAVWVAIVSGPIERAARWLGKRSAIAWAVGSAIAFGLAWLVRFEDALVLAIVVSAVPLVLAMVAALVRKRMPGRVLGVAHVLAIGLWLLVDRATTVTVDYYRYWGGSQRRIGSPELAERAYRRLIEVSPEAEIGHYHLGRLLVRRGATDEGLAHLREAQRLEPARARAFVEEARVLHQQGKAAEAIEKAKQATFADPSHSEARSLLEWLLADPQPQQPAPEGGDAPAEPGSPDDSD